MRKLHESKLAWNSTRSTLKELENQEINRTWFERWSDSLSQYSDLYIQALWDFYGNTNDPATQERLNHITQKIKPECNNLNHTLICKSSEWQTDDPNLARIVGKHRQEVHFGKPEAVELDKEIDAWVQQYDEAVGSLTLNGGETLSLAQAETRCREEKNRDTRRELWTQIQDVRSTVNPRIDELFLKLVELRRNKARACGFENFLEFSWSELGRDSYSPADALHVVEGVQHAFASVYERKSGHLASKLSINAVRPWDVIPWVEEVGSNQRFNEDTYARSIVAAFNDISPELGKQVESMVARGNMDLMARPFKDSINFSSVLCVPNHGLVFCNGTGDVASLRVMMHETGHAIHHERAGQHNLMFERTPSKEIMEFVAYCLQFLAIEALAQTGTLGASEHRQLKLFVAETLLRVFEITAPIEQFQHWLYSTNRNISVAELNEAWLGYRDTFGTDWSGYENYLEKGWQDGHIVRFPLYNFEYIVAYLGMLIFIDKYRAQPEQTIRQLEDMLAFGDSKTTVESFAAVGITFPFDTKDINSARQVFEREFIQGLF